MATTPFSRQPTAPIDPNRGAALQGIRDRSGGGAAPPAQDPAQGPPIGGPGASVSDKFAELAQLVMQTGLTPEVLSAFEGFIQFFQQVAAQAQGGAPGAPPGQAPPPGPAGPPVGPGGPPLG